MEALEARGVELVGLVGLVELVGLVAVDWSALPAPSPVVTAIG